MAFTVSGRLFVGLATAFWAVAAHSQTTPSAVTQAGITLRSVSVELPSNGRTFAGGKEAEAINANCITCHSAGMVINQPALPQATWQEEVTKMRVLYKAPIAEQDVPAIVAYLTSIKGAK